MEKLLYPLWKTSGQNIDDFRNDLVKQLGPDLAAIEGVHGVRLAIADSDVSEADGRRMISHAPAPDALLSLWVDNAGGAQAWEPVVEQRVDHMSAYLVAEAEPLVPEQAHPCSPGERLYGMCHVVFLKKPAGQSREDWLAVWKDSHTQIAIDTQSTFGYRQNVIVRAMGDHTVPCDAIVEEHFPSQAMASDHAFYDAEGNDALLQERMTAMMESVGRFVDFEHLDVLPMSEYLIKGFHS